MKLSIRAATEKIFEWGSVAAGLLILGSCTYSGFEKSGPASAVWAFLLSAFGAMALIAFVFMLTRTSADIRAIRDRLDKSDPGA
jgi:hypothetical protein